LHVSALRWEVACGLSTRDGKSAWRVACFMLSRPLANLLSLLSLRTVGAYRASRLHTQRACPEPWALKMSDAAKTGKQANIASFFGGAPKRSLAVAAGGGAGEQTPGLGAGAIFCGYATRFWRPRLLAVPPSPPELRELFPPVALPLLTRAWRARHRAFARSLTQSLRLHRQVKLLRRAKRSPRHAVC